MELVITKQEKALPVEWNYTEIKAWAEELSKQYKGMIVQENQIGFAKEKRADLNRVAKMLDDARKQKKKEFLEPYEQFEQEIKEVAGIITDASKAIDVQLKDFEERRKAEKRTQIIEMIDAMDKPVDWVTSEMLMQDNYTNVTFSMNKVKQDVEVKIGKIAQDLEIIRALTEYAFEAEDRYAKSLDLSDAMREVARLQELAKKKADSEAKSKEEDARANIEPVPKAEPESEPEPQADVPVKREYLRFEALLTIEQAIALREWFVARNIKFRSI